MLSSQGKPFITFPCFGKSGPLKHGLYSSQCCVPGSTSGPAVAGEVPKSNQLWQNKWSKTINHRANGNCYKFEAAEYLPSLFSTFLLSPDVLPSCYFARFTAQGNTYNSIYNSQLFKPKFGWLQKSIFITIKMSLTKEKSETDLNFKHSSNPSHFIAVFAFTATGAGGCTRPTTVHQI